MEAQQENVTVATSMNSWNSSLHGSDSVISEVSDYSSPIPTIAPLESYHKKSKNKETITSNPSASSSADNDTGTTQRQKKKTNSSSSSRNSSSSSLSSKKKNSSKTKRRSLALDYIPESKKEQRRHSTNGTLHSNSNENENDDTASEYSDAASNASSLNMFQLQHQDNVDDRSLESSNSQPSVIADIMSKRQQSQQQQPSSSSSLSDIVVSDTMNADNAYTIGRLRLDNGDYTIAKKYFERALRAREADHGWNSLMVVEVHESLGDANGGMGNAMGAMKHYLTGIDILSTATQGDDDDGVDDNAAALSRMESKLDQLIVAYEMKLSISFKLGSMFLSHGQYVRAERCLENALRNGNNDDDDDGGINKAFVLKKLGDVKLALGDIRSSIIQYESCLDLLHDSGEYELAADIFTLLDDLRRQRKQQEKEKKKINSMTADDDSIVVTKHDDTTVDDAAAVTTAKTAVLKQQTTTTSDETAPTTTAAAGASSFEESDTSSATAAKQQRPMMTTTTTTSVAATTEGNTNGDDNNPMHHPDEPNDANYRRACYDIIDGNLSSAKTYLQLSHEDYTKRQVSPQKNHQHDISLAFIEERLGDVAAMEGDAIRGCHHYNKACDIVQKCHASGGGNDNNTMMMDDQKVVSRIVAKTVELCLTRMTSSSDALTCLEMLPVVGDYGDVDDIVSQMLQSAVRRYEKDANDAIERNDVSKAMMHYNAAMSVTQFYLMRVEVNRDNDDDGNATTGDGVVETDDDGYYLKVNQNDTLKVLMRISDGIEQRRQRIRRRQRQEEASQTKDTTDEIVTSRKDQITMGIILHNVGVYYDRQNMLDEAMECYNQSLEMKRKVYDDDNQHAAIVNTMSSISHIRKKKTSNDDDKESSLHRNQETIEKSKERQNDDTKKKTSTSSDNKNSCNASNNNTKKTKQKDDTTTTAEKKITPENNNNNSTKKTKQNNDTTTTAEKKITPENNNNNNNSYGTSLRQSLESLNNSSYIYLKQSDYTMAAQLFEDKLKLLKTHNIDKNDTEFAMTYYQLGAIYTVTSRTEEAISSFNQAVAIFRHLNNSIDASRTFHKLASLHSKLGNNEMAIECHEQVLSLKDGLDDTGDDTNNNSTTNIETTRDDRSSTLLDLASLCFARGSFNKSLKYYESALRDIKDGDGIAGRAKIFTLNRMGVLDMMMGDFNKALMRLRRAVAADNKLPPVVAANNDDGDDDKKLAARVGYYLLNNMGNIYLLANKGRSKALACYQQALELANSTAANAAKVMSSSSTDVPPLLFLSSSSQSTNQKMNNNILRLTMTITNIDDNPLVIHDNLGVCNLVDGEIEVSLDVGIIHHNIGVVKLLQREYAHAIDHFEKSLQIKEDHLNIDATTTNNHDLLGTLTNLGTCRYYVNDCDGAIESFDKALPIAEKMTNDDDDYEQQHQSPAHCDLRIANLLIKRGNTYAKSPKKLYSSAKSDYEQALSLKEKVFKDDPSHPEILSIRHDLSLILCKLKLFDESLLLLNDVYTRTMETFGGKSDVIEVAKVVLDRGSVYLSMGKPKRAQKDCESALKVFRTNNLPESHAYMQQATYIMEKMKRNSTMMKSVFKKSRRSLLSLSKTSQRRITG